MTDVGYVIAGWGIAAMVLAGYSVRLVLRIRQAERDDAPRNVKP